MQQLQNKIESLLFLDSKPLTLKKLAHACGVTEAEVEDAVNQLQSLYDQRGGGVMVIKEGKNVQLMTAPQQSDFVRDYLKQEEIGELTRPSLETLTIITYRGPVAKSEVELIRGVNCSLILRNLMIRGLVEQVGETDSESPVYRVTLEFLRSLGVNKASDLPNYKDLNENVHLEELLQNRKDPDDFFQGDMMPSNRN